MALTPAERTARWRERNPEKAREKSRAHYHKNVEANRERSRLSVAKVRAKDPEAYRAYMREYKRANPHVDRKAQIKLKYGLTLEQVEEIFVAQGSCCAICKSDYQGPTKSCPIDHDHRTGKVRGIICHPCNLGLRKPRDTVEHLEAAIAYLKKSLPLE